MWWILKWIGHEKVAVLDGGIHEWNKKGGKLVTERIYEAFKKIGYEIPHSKDLKNAVFSAADLGVPQKRNRVIIIGIKTANSRDLKLESIYNEIKNQFVSLYSNDSLEHICAQNLRVEVSAPYLLDSTGTLTLISCLLVSFCVVLFI